MRLLDVTERIALIDLDLQLAGRDDVPQRIGAAAPVDRIGDVDAEPAPRHGQRLGGEEAEIERIGASRGIARRRQRRR